MEQHVFCAATPTSWSVYWDKPENAPRHCAYTVVLEGREPRRVSKTHCTFRDLAPDTALRAEVYLEEELIGSVEGRTMKQPRRIDVTAEPYCAVGNDMTMNTERLQRAIDDCGPGDEVYFPRGVYLTGALRLHSDMSLYLDKGAVLQGSEQPEDYLPRIPSRFEGVERECYQSLLNLGNMDHTSGPNCKNVLIWGEGTISGGGQALSMRTIESERESMKDYLDSLGDRIHEYEKDDTIPGRARGRLINMSNCEHVRVTGLTLRNGASWNLHMIYSRDIVTDHCIFRSQGIWNGDGWGPDSSEDCVLFACEFHTEDDSVAIKSGKNPEGNAIARPTRNIRIFHCVSHQGHGIALGSEVSGGIENVAIWDCDLRYSLYGVLIKATRKRGGYVKNVVVRDSTLPRFTVASALRYNDDGEPAKEPPVFSDFRCDRIHFTGWSREYWEDELHLMPCVDLSGYDEPGYEVQNVSITRCYVENGSEISVKGCRNIRVELDQVNV